MAVVADTPIYEGLDIVRGTQRYDLQPSILYNPSNNLDANQNGVPDHLYTMAWLGRYAAGDADSAPANLATDDRIYVAFSENGNQWSTPQVALKGLGGTGGALTADDHLLGSPSLLSINGKQYMFYEAYSTWATPINRFYSFARGDNWVTNGVDLPTSNNGEGYTFERNLGFAPLLVKAGTHPVYSGEVAYHFPTGNKINRYLSNTVPFIGERDGASWQVRNGGQPVFWLYDQPAAGRKALYSFFDPAHSNTYVSDSPNGENVPGAILVEVLGYAAERLDGPDMTGASQNRIMMATSSDGLNWTRFQGPQRGGAVIAPQNELTTTYDPQSWQLKAEYGSGYPSATVRDNNLELYFTDEDAALGPDLRRVRLPVSQIENPQTWLDARAPGSPSLSQSAPYGSDIKWSPIHGRYFASYLKNLTPGTHPESPDFRQVATVIWSDLNPDPTLPATFPEGNEVILPNGGRNAVWGGIAGNALGNTIDVGGSDPRSVLDVYFESYAPGTNHVFDADIAHASVVLHRQSDVLPAPEISVDSYNSHQSTIAFGSATSGAAEVVKPFTIRNDGTADLTISAISTSGDFRVIGGLPVNISPGSSLALSIAMNTLTVGIKSGDLTIASNDADENPFVIHLAGEVVATAAPEMDITGVNDGQTTPIDIGTVVVGSTGPIKTFVVTNSGTGPLRISSVTAPLGYTITQNLPTTMPAGTSSNLTIRLNSGTVGVFQGRVSIINDDANENPYDFPVQGTVLSSSPEISIDGVVDGQTAPILFPTGFVSHTGPSKTFIIRNVGTAPLRLSNLTIPTGFSVTKPFAATVAPNASTTFTLQLNTSSAGTSIGPVSITTNDADENPFNFPIKGVVWYAAREITVPGIVDGQTTPINFGAVDSDAVRPERTFTILNEGATDLLVSRVTVPSGYSIVKLPATVLHTGQSDTLVIRLSSPSAGLFTGQVVITNNDSNENPFNFPLRGQVNLAAPELVVSVNGSAISTTTGSYLLGTTYQNATSPTLRVTIANRGNRPLNLSSWSVPSGYVVSGTLPSQILPGNSVDVNLKLDVRTIGIKQGTFAFSSNDADEARISLAVRGRVYTPVTIVAGNAATTAGGIYTITTNSSAQISIDKPYGNMPSNGQYVITVNGSRITIDGTLTRIRIRGTTLVPNLQNWTNIPIEYV